MVNSPSALVRIFGFFYIQILNKLHLQCSEWLTQLCVPPAVILYFCMLSILSMHIPALWSKRINVHLCVMQLEKNLLYFGVLQTMILIWGNRSATVNSCAALCMAWYVWTNLKRDWLPMPENMKFNLVIYFIVCVPLLWLVMPLEKNSSALVENHQLLVTVFLCDISLICLECVLQAYGRLWEVMMVLI
jgi:hypothetical protein